VGETTVPRPRFAKLPAAQQETILRVALAEFAAHGFADASLNRIIQDAGISKGSLYYYFDGKEDLYAHVARGEVARLIQRSGPFPVPETDDPDVFWTTLVDYYSRLMEALLASPESAALVRGWISAAATDPALQLIQRELESTALTWFTAALATGQAIGAVRTDVPDELLLAVVLAMGQALDVWLIGQHDETEQHHGAAGEETGSSTTASTLIGMIRRAVQP
jgi:AcrR family transcriptional regulator